MFQEKTPAWEFGVYSVWRLGYLRRVPGAVRGSSGITAAWKGGKPRAVSYPRQPCIGERSAQRREPLEA
jgi:hypothetical protein